MNDAAPDDDTGLPTTGLPTTGLPTTGLLTTGRLEAFSDGVFAIAITLLVLDLAVPPRGDHRSLASGLGHEWPSYFAYAVSFLVIGIIWINHHVLCTLVRRVDRRVLFANLFLLLSVSLIPFPTRVLAEYLTAGDNDAHVAAAFYSGTALAMAVGFSLMFLAINRDARLVLHPMDRATRRKALVRFSGGGVVYAALIGLSFVSAIATLAVHGALAVYYCFDQLAPARTP